MPNTIFDCPDLSAFTRLDGLGLEVTGQRIEPDHTVLACRITGSSELSVNDRVFVGGVAGIGRGP